MDELLGSAFDDLFVGVVPVLRTEIDPCRQTRQPCGLGEWFAGNRTNEVTFVGMHA